MYIYHKLKIIFKMASSYFRDSSESGEQGGGGSPHPTDSARARPQSFEGSLVGPPPPRAPPALFLFSLTPHSSQPRTPSTLLPLLRTLSARSDFFLLWSQLKCHLLI